MRGFSLVDYFAILWYKTPTGSLIIYELDWRWCFVSTIEDFDASIAKLERERADLWNADIKLFAQMKELNYTGPEYEVLRKQQSNLWKQQRVLGESIAQLHIEKRTDKKRFHRPTGPIGTFFSKWLGPLPNYNWQIHPTPEAYAKAKSYRLLALGMVIVAIATLITLIVLFPWMSVSPASLILLLAKFIFGEAWGGLAGGVMTVGLMLFCTKYLHHQNSYRGKFLNGAAMFEEQWFRMGAENWSPGQRIRSCIVFGAVHIMNIIYPLAGLLVVGLMGAVFMAVYLHVFKKTGSTKHATIASAKLHATYNRFAIGYLVVAIGVSLAAQAYIMFV